MLFSSFSTRSMVFAYFAKAQLPFSLFRDLFNDTAEFTLCYGLHDCSHLFQGYFIHSLSTLYYYNAPSLTTRLTGDYRDRTYTGKCSPALLDTRNKKAANLFQTYCFHWPRRWRLVFSFENSFHIGMINGELLRYVFKRKRFLLEYIPQNMQSLYLSQCSIYIVFQQ